ncbi:MAG: metal-dependent transcriptional regulator [Desulfosarcina sp.]|nr:metal-dependent transcriptional regulator [Desulfobacterales bacterium]
MAKKNKLTESMEDYLEVILELERVHKSARAKDIATRLEVQRGTVTGALKTLAEKGLINYAPYSHITLTPKGAAIAGEINRRHKVIRNFLTEVLQIPPETAETTACRMEHVVEGTVLDRLVCFIDFVHQCPRAGDDLLSSFTRYCESGRLHWEDCQACMEDCQERFQSQ